ncbi:MAG: Gfo/Idh/MocA family oxidoreductase [Planctomycetes bacterium]|nr:Gfo/Idh/MocA family oxidoreductase [Planctomycetota bacterium]
MKNIAMIGTQIIHTYPYLAYFNGFDPERVQKNAKAWMAKMLEGKPNDPKSGAVRITHVWTGEDDEAKRLAESCAIENIADSPDAFVDDVDGVMVMDEEIDQRAGLIRPFIEAGKAVFVDKTLSLDPSVTEELLSLSKDTGAQIAAYSQLRFGPGFEELKGMARGGVALASFRLNLDILPMYSIHLISAVHGIFGTGIQTLRKLDCPNGVEVRATYGDGTRVVMQLGPDAPAGWNICYFAKDGCALAAPGENADMFEASARAIEKMLVEGEPPVSTEEISEASKLVNFIVGAEVGEERMIG